MAHILDTPDDEFGVQTRRESFILTVSEARAREQVDGVWIDGRPIRPMWPSESVQEGRGSVEFQLVDIPALRRALDRVEEAIRLRDGKVPWGG